MDWYLYETKLYATGETAAERQINQAKEDFCREAVENPAYKKALRNGVEQRFLITRSETPEKYKIVAFPDEELCVGDEIEVFGEHWIVYQVRVEDTLQKSGIIWMCNHKFRWQNFTSDIVEKWGVLDSGVYSTTIKGEAELRYKDKQFKLIFPLDEDTRKLFIDKRMAVDVVYDKFGSEILNVYQITGYDSVGESFGNGGHLLILNLRSDEFNRNTDNISELICDYITPDGDEPGAALQPCRIDGADEIRIGTKRTYTGVFDGSSPSEIRWGASLNEVALSASGDTATVFVPDSETLVGTNLVLTLSEAQGVYSPCEKAIKIIAL